MMSGNGNERRPHRRPTRRQFVQLGACGATALAAGAALRGAPAVGRPSRPNLLLVLTDQQHIETIAAASCPHVQTPALDGLCRRGRRFEQSFSANPLCSPDRSSVFTGRMSSETGVFRNGLPVRRGIPNLGQWLSAQAGYEALYAGKWHLPRSFTHNIPGFRVLAAGVGGQGNLGDATVSRVCEAFLRRRSGSRPFLLVASFLQPHDICQWLRINQDNRDQLRFPQIRDELPELPANFTFDHREPEAIRRRRNNNEPGPSKGRWGREHWRYYIWSYYRHVEMVDAEIGRVLLALQESGRARDTLVLFTSDHGEGLGRHQMVRKNFLYDEAVRVPLVVSWPGHVAENRADTTHLVSGIDVMSTLCDYAGVQPPRGALGRSLRPLLEGRRTEWRPFVVSEVLNNSGRMVRTPRYKYITYRGDPLEQLFDVQGDPAETRNLAGSAQHAAALAEHRRLLSEWESRLDVAPNVLNPSTWRERAR